MRSKKKIAVPTRKILIGGKSELAETKEKLATLVAAAKKAQQHLDDCEGGAAWDVLDEALEEIGEK